MDWIRKHLAFKRDMPVESLSDHISRMESSVVITTSLSTGIISLVFDVRKIKNEKESEHIVYIFHNVVCSVADILRRIGEQYERGNDGEMGVSEAQEDNTESIAYK
jgi:hypothetical protein